MEIEDLIGKDIHHKDNPDLIYTIADCIEGRCRIVWNSTDDVYYRDSEIVNYIEKGIWILIN
jgi:hypothetical protein